MLGCIGFLQLSLKGDERKSEDGKSGFIQMPIFGYKMPYHRYLSLSILMMLYFVIKSFTRCRGRCTLDVNGRVLGAKCPLYLVSESQRQIRLLCTSSVVSPFHISSCLPSPSAEGKWPACFSTSLCSFSSLEPLTAAVNQNRLGVEVEGEWSQDTGMQTFVYSVQLHFLMATIL